MLVAMALGWTHEHGWVDTGQYGVRSMITRPRIDARHPALLYLQGIGPQSLDVRLEPADPRDPIAGLINHMSGAGLVTMRVDRAGVGQSGGPAYGEADLDCEIRTYASALRTLAALPFVDPQRLFLFGSSLGGVIAPLVAAAQPVRGVVTWGTPCKPWSACLAEGARRQLMLAGMESPRLDLETAAAARLYRALLDDGASAAATLASDAALASCIAARDLDGEQLHGRSLRFFQQLEKVPFKHLWRQIRPPLFAMQGSLDWIVSRGANETLASWVSASDGDAMWRRFDGVDHDMQRHPSVDASFRRRGSAPFATEVAVESALWLAARW